MKKNIACLLLGLLLTISVLPSALAASKANQVPKLTFSTFKTKLSSGHTKDYGIKATLPGFLDLWVTDAGGATVRVYASKLEIHDQINYFTIYTTDESGNRLPAGDYTLHAKLLSQNKIESEELAKVFTIPTYKASSTKNNAVSSAILTADSAAALGIGLGDTSTTTSSAATSSAATSSTTDSATTSSASDTSSSSSDTASSAAQTASADTSSVTGQSAVSISSDLSYAQSSSVMVGVEGFQIGVGVSDSAANDGSAWSLTANSTDAEIWAALTRDIVSVNVDEKESAYIYDSTDSDRKQIGTVSGYSQGLHVIAERSDGWSLVEAYRNEDSAFVRGYIKTKTLETHNVSQKYGIVIDKATQTLIVYNNGLRIGSCKVCTGLATSKYLSRETPAGEFLMATRQGTVEYYKTDDWCKYTIRINGSYNLMEIPTTRKNGTDYSPMVSLLGMKSTRGSIIVAHDPSSDGNVNAELIWEMSDKKNMSSKARIKVIILDDKPRYSVPSDTGM